jgi:hypothetical protein
LDASYKNTGRIIQKYQMMHHQLMGWTLPWVGNNIASGPKMPSADCRRTGSECLDLTAQLPELKELTKRQDDGSTYVISPEAAVHHELGCYGAELQLTP